MEMKTFQEFIAEAYIKKSEVSGHVNVSRGAVPGKATEQSVRGAVTRALANPGQAQSASSEKGRMKTTVSGGINVTGTLSTGSKPKPKKLKPEPEPESETRKPREVNQRPTRQGGRKPREVTQGGSGTPQKPTQIVVRGDGKGTRRTSLRDLSSSDRQRVLNNMKPMPSTAGKYAGWRPTAVILNKTSTGTRTDKVYQPPSTSSAPRSVSRDGVRQAPTQSSSRNPGGVRQVSQQPSSGNQGGVRQVSQQSSTDRAPRRVSQPSSLGSRTRSVF